MERVHDPIIFQNSLDGIDLKTHIVATYRMSDTLPGVDFIDHFKLIESIAIEGSTGTWEKVAEDSEDVREHLSGKLVGYYELPAEGEFTRSAVIQLAFPINAWHDNVPMMLLSIAGNCFAYSQKIRLLDVFYPEEMVKNFKGPKFGVPGIRKLLGVEERPLSLHIIKPKMGMTPKQTGDQVYQTAIGGADMCKDDEMTSDTYNNNFRDRL
jgi:2,3-diketo-5-methylthiopentyl-1-phosphate enolase